MQIIRSKTEPLSNGIRRYLDSIGAAQKIKGIKLKNSWYELMSSEIVKNTESMYIEKSVLHIKFNNSVVKHEILMNKSKFTQRLNNNAKEKIISDIKVL